MSVTTNIVAKMKQLFYNAGDNSNAVSDAVDIFNDFEVTLFLNTDNSIVCYSPPVDCKLVGAKILAGVTNITCNTAANTTVYTINTNGVTVNTFNTDAKSADIGAGTAYNLTVNTVNSFVDAGEICKVTLVNDQAGDDFPQHIALRFRRQ